MAKKKEKKEAKVQEERTKLQNLGEFVSAAKEARVKSGGGKLSPQAKRSRAEKALLAAMTRRGWKQTKEGYQLSSHTVTLTGKDNVLVDGEYTLQLGKGAINELDAYMKVPA